MNKAEIEKLVDKYKEIFCGPNWNWRKGQKEVIINILDLYFNSDIKHVVAECPTGAGKSHIAMCVSWVLNNCDIKAKGYILASDIALQDQYEEDIFKMNLKWGSVKGIDRYTCEKNDEPISLGHCKMCNTPPKNMDCYKQCQYYSRRDFAAHSPTALLNYSYWLLQMNYVKENSDEPLFVERDFTICDEAHKITDIIQSHFSPKIQRYVIFENFKKIKLFLNNTIKTFKFDEDIIKLVKAYDLLFKSDDKLTVYKILSYLAKEGKTIVKMRDFIDDYVNETYLKLRIKVPASYNKIYKVFDYFKDLCCKMCDYTDIINKAGLQSLIINKQSKDDIVYNCLEEKYLMEKFFHKQKNFTLYLSATIGDPQQYFIDMGISNGTYIAMQSNFDFVKSPIYYHSSRKMSYNKMTENFPWLVKMIDDILEKYPNEKGIIHSASYDLTMKIHEALSSKNQNRLIVYSGAEEKQQGIDKMSQENTNKVLIGPSLIEGVNLPDDKCRFIIFAKVPYLSLGDKFVKEKMTISPAWYKSKAIISVLQGVGRGVRSETDYCDTYILDGNFGDLLINRKAFPQEFINRIKRCS